MIETPTVFNPIEVEIKSWLKTKEKANQLKKELTKIGFFLNSTNNQLNHYFVGDNFLGLESIDSKIFVLPESFFKLKEILNTQANFSLRTRQKDSKVFLIIKASLDSTTSSNGISRMEFEEQVNLELEELDQLIINFGFQYQAKWSRQRQELTSIKQQNMTVCIDCNAGYGYLAEFEILVQNQNEIEQAKQEIFNLMESLELKELPQELLAKMFSYYNVNWQQYYGTDMTFDESDLSKN